MAGRPSVRWNEGKQRWMAWVRFPDGSRRKVERVEKADAERDSPRRAAAIDPGLDLAVLDRFMERVRAMRSGPLGLDAESYQALVDDVQIWRGHIRQLHAKRSVEPPERGHGLEL